MSATTTRPTPRRPIQAEFVTTEDSAVNGEQTYKVAGAVYDLTRQRLDEIESIASDERLSDTGKLEKIRDTHDDARGRLEPFRTVLERQAERIEKLREGLTPADPLDPSDAVGAQDRRERRTWLRELPGTKRTAALRDAMARAQGGDSEAVELLTSVVSAPAELSGITGALRNTIAQQLIRERHPERIERIEALEKNTKALGRVLRSAEKTIEDAKVYGGRR